MTCNCYKCKSSCEIKCVKKDCLPPMKKLHLDDIFSENCDDCDVYEDAANKAELTRNAFFGAKTALVNFVNDVTSLEEKIQNDISDAELECIEIEYTAIMNTMTAGIYASLKKDHKQRSLVNIDLVTSSNDISDFNVLRSNEIELVQPGCSIRKIINILAYIPGVTIHINEDTNQVDIRFSEPKYMSSFSITNRKNNDVVIELTIVGPTVNFDGLGNNAFDTVDTARDFFDDIINYQQGDSDTNDLLEVFCRFNKVILSTENAYRTVSQLAKINGASKCIPEK